MGRRGRPKGTGLGITYFNVGLEPQQIDALDDFAKQRKVSRAGAARVVIDHGLQAVGFAPKPFDGRITFGDAVAPGAKGWLAADSRALRVDFKHGGKTYSGRLLRYADGTWAGTWSEREGGEGECSARIELDATSIQWVDGTWSEDGDSYAWSASLLAIEPA